MKQLLAAALILMASSADAAGTFIAEFNGYSVRISAPGVDGSVTEKAEALAAETCKSAGKRAEYQYTTNIAPNRFLHFFACL